MNNQINAAAAAVFPASAKADKGDATTRAARAIIERETADRNAKTARLKALRLAKEAEAVPADAQKKPAAKKAKAAPKKKTAARKAG